jgi:chromosome segregation ATPase
MPIAKTGKWGPGSVARPAPAPGLKATTFADLVIEQVKIARSAKEVSTTLNENLVLTRDLAEARAMVFSSLVPAVQAHDALVRQLIDRVAKLEQRTDSSAPAREITRLDGEVGAVVHILETLEQRFEELEGRVAALDSRLAGVEAHCGALEAETEEIESQLAKAARKRDARP